MIPLIYRPKCPEFLRKTKKNPDNVKTPEWPDYIDGTSQKCEFFFWQILFFFFIIYTHIYTFCIPKKKQKT